MIKTATEAIERKNEVFNSIKEKYENFYLKGDRNPNKFTDAHGIFIGIINIVSYLPKEFPNARPTKDEFLLLFEMIMDFACDTPTNSMIFQEHVLHPNPKYRPRHPFEKQCALGYWTRELVKTFLEGELSDGRLSPEGTFYKYFFEAIFKESEKGGDE